MAFLHFKVDITMIGWNPHINWPEKNDDDF